MTSPWNDPPAPELPDEELELPEEDDVEPQLPLEPEVLPPDEAQQLIPTPDQVPAPAGAVVVLRRAQVLADAMLALPVPQTDEHYARLARYLEESKALQDALEAEHRPHIQRAHALWKGLLEGLNKDLKPLTEQADPHVRRIGGEYARQREARAKAERDRLLAEQRAARELEALTAASQLQEAGRADEAAQVLEDAQRQPLVEPPSPPPLKAPGLGVTVDYEVTITDPDLVPRHYCVPDLKLLKAVVKSNKGQVLIPGVRVTELPKVVRRGKA